MKEKLKIDHAKRNNYMLKIPLVNLSKKFWYICYTFCIPYISAVKEIFDLSKAKACFEQY